MNFSVMFCHDIDTSKAFCMKDVDIQGKGKGICIQTILDKGKERGLDTIMLPDVRCEWF